MPNGTAGPEKKNFRSGKWKVVHLKFLVDFMDRTGMTTGDIAKQLNLSRQTVYHWLVKDDVRLSNIYSLFDAMGYDITFRYVKEGARPDEPIVTGDDSEVTMVLKEEKSRALSFMRNAMSRYNILLQDISQKMDIGSSTMYYWLKKDDCFMSYVYKFAEASGLKVTVTIVPKES